MDGKLGCIGCMIIPRKKPEAILGNTLQYFSFKKGISAFFYSKYQSQPQRSHVFSWILMISAICGICEVLIFYKLAIMEFKD